jgi:hypothetical protein
MFSLRKLVGAVALVGATLGVAACGGSSPQTQDVSVDSTPIAVRQAADTTAAQSTAAVATTVDMMVGDRKVSMTGSGQLDSTTNQYTQTFDMIQLFEALGQTAPAGATAPFTVVADGSIVYVSSPGFSQMSGGKPWMKFDSAGGNSILDLLGGSGGGAFTTDPAAFLRFLDGAGKVTNVGTESILGTPTTHYQGTYTINDSLSTLSPDDRDRVTKQFDGLGFPLNARDEAIDFDAWVGSDGLVRRVSTTFDVDKLAPTPNSTSKLGDVTVTVDYSDFGAPVQITVPPADQVQDLSGLVPKPN